MPATKKTAAKKTAPAFTTDEQAAMKARSDEIKAAKKKGGEDDEPALLAKIAEMPPSDRKLAEQVHRIVRDSGPELTCRTWYGMPAYAKDGKVVCWFKAADKFKARYATIGFSDQAALDNGNMWPTEYAVTDLTQADEAKLAKLVKQAVR
ncbi:MAG: iron chaperone [Actinomycetales bacterium]